MIQIANFGTRAVVRYKANKGGRTRLPANEATLRYQSTFRNYFGGTPYTQCLSLNKMATYWCSYSLFLSIIFLSFLFSFFPFPFPLFLPFFFLPFFLSATIKYFLGPLVPLSAIFSTPVKLIPKLNYLVLLHNVWC